jgi:hypothetical protein
MKKVCIILFILFTFLLSLTLYAGDDLNEIAYQNRSLLKAGTILNNEGKGDCLIFPYYDVRMIDGYQQVTTVNIMNIGEYGIAAKLRFREWSRGREVFSKDIWIPSSGVWTANIEMAEDGSNAIITSFDSAVWRFDSNSFYFSNPLSGGSLFSTKNIRKKNGESTLFGYIEVIGEEKTSPESIDGKVGRLSKSERDCPNTLKGQAFINRLEGGVSVAYMGYDAVAIGNFSRGQGSLFRSVRSSYPRLDTCEDSLDQLEFQLSKWEIFGPYSVSPSNQGKTSIIVAYPTKNFHYRNGKRINQVNNPFEAPKETTGEIIKTALSEQSQKLADSNMTLPFSVNVIGLYQDYLGGGPKGIDNVPLTAYSYESGETILTSDNIAHRVLIDDYEYLQERFMMYRGLPAVGLVLQESRDSGQLNATLTAVEYSTNWVPSYAETISIPTTPSGPTSGITGTSYTFTTGGSSSNFGHPIQYFFDWGDGTNSDWLPVGTATASKTWTTGGVFTVRARARCATDTDTVSNWSIGMTVSIGVETVSAPTIPTGPSFGVVNNYSQSEYPFDKSYSFTTGGSTSSLSHPIQYQIDWGDGTNSGWLPVGTISASKIWTTGGVFTVKAMARCATHTDFVSNPSSGLVVTVESVSPPNMLSGPANVVPNTQYTYSTGGAFSNLSGHQVQYFFDWGDDTNSGWLPVGTTTATKIWPPGNATNKGVYYVKARARCVTDVLAVSVWTSQLKVVIEWVSPPTSPVSVGPNDPNAGQPGQSFTFSTGNAFSSVGHPVEYQFDWKGNGTDLSPWGSATQSKTWTTGGTYSVRARARCVTDISIVSDWSSGLAVKIEQISVSTPTGQSSGIPNTPYTYTASGSSNIGDPVQIRFAFSDGTDSGWLPTGTTSFSKTWTSTGSFTVTAKAKCALHPGNESAWSAALAVTVNNPAPTTTSISPTSKTAGDLGFILTVNGMNFVSTSVVRFNGSDRTTTFVTGTKLTAAILASDLTTAGTFSITVFNPTPGGGPSNAQTFTVNNPAPTVSGITPSTGVVGTTVNITNLSGTGFVSGATVKLTKSGSADISGTSVVVVSSTQITCTFNLTGAATGLWDVVVTNAAPGGGPDTLTGGFTVTP